MGYLVGLLFLTASVILALDEEKPELYEYDHGNPKDILRGFCECVVIILAMGTLTTELLEAYKYVP